MLSYNAQVEITASTIYSIRRTCMWPTL